MKPHRIALLLLLVSLLASASFGQSFKLTSGLLIDASGNLLINSAASGGSVSTTLSSGLKLDSNGYLLVDIASGGGAPSGNAGGDLGGTYPNPTVVSVADVNTGVLYLGGLNNSSPAGGQFPYIDGAATALNWLSLSNTNCFLQNSGTAPQWDGNLCDASGNLTYLGTITATQFIGTGPYYVKTVFAGGALSLPGAANSALAVDQNGAWNLSENNGAFATIPTFVTNAQTSTYQATTADFAQCKTIPVASGTFTITLVASGTQPLSGQCLNIVNYGSGAVTIARSGQNINGAAANFTLSAGSASAPTSATITSDGTNYIATIDQGTVGTVTSVAQTVPSGFAIGGSPISTSGTLAITYSVSGAGQVINSSGSNAAGFTAAEVLGVASTSNGTLTLSSSGSATQVQFGENSSAQATLNNALALTGTTAPTTEIITTNPGSGLTITGTAPGSSAGAGTAAGAVLTITGVAGGATTGSATTAGVGSTVGMTAGNGGSGAGGTNAIGGAGGGLTLTGGTGGSSGGTAANSNGGSITLNPGAAGTGGSGAAGSAGQVVTGGQLSLANGTCTNPGLTFTGTTTFGFFPESTTKIGLCSNNAHEIDFGTTLIEQGDANTYSFSQTASAAGTIGLSMGPNGSSGATEYWDFTLGASTNLLKAGNICTVSSALTLTTQTTICSWTGPNLGKTWGVMCQGVYTTTTTSIAMSLGFTLSQSPTATATGSAIIWSAASTQTFGTGTQAGTSAQNILTGASVASATTNMPWHLDLTVPASATSGTITIWGTASTSSDVTVEGVCWIG